MGRSVPSMMNSNPGQAATLLNNPIFAGLQLLFIPQCPVQDWCQPVNPIPCLGLSHAKQIPLHFLNRIELEIEQDENKFDFHRLEYALPASSSFTLPFVFPFGIPAIQIIFVGLTKCGQ